MSASDDKFFSKQVCLESVMQNQPTLNIGMIGHVAHGKTTLARALSGITTAKFRAEQVANMTIKLGYANVKIYKCTAAGELCPPPWCYRACGGAQKEPPVCQRPGCGVSTELVRHVSLVDAPGHVSFITTMLSGASVMDAALLLVASDQVCPCPQTVEHLVAAEVLGVAKNTLVVQNKVDLCTPRRCAESYLEIQEFLKGSCAENAPIVPVAAEAGFNVDFLCQWIAEKIPAPQRDFVAPARMRLVRSFDVNKPGSKVPSMHGGVVGGAIIQGVLWKGTEVEIRPGLMTANGAFRPIRTKVVSLLSENNPLEVAVPGGLVAVGLEVDPVLSKDNRLAGQTLGLLGSLPPVFRSLEVSYALLRSVVADAKEKGDTKPKPPKPKEVLLLCVGAAQVQATVVKSQSKILQLLCNNPLCGEIGELVVLFRAVKRHWRVIGSGKIVSLVPLPVPASDDLPSLTLGQVQNGPLEVKINMPQEVAPVSEVEDSEEDDTDVRLILTEELIASWQKAFDLSTNTCRMQESALPQPESIVMAQIDSVDPEVGAYCRLLEYEGGNCLPNETANEGPHKALVIATEISGRRIRSMKQEVRPGKMEAVLVMRVDHDSGFVDVSRKRVTSEDRKVCEEQFGSSQVVHSIMARVSAINKIPLPALYRAIVWPLSKRSFPHVLDAFHHALHDYESIFGSLALPAAVNETIRQSLEHRLQSRPAKVAAKVSLSCFLPEGVKFIKLAFEHGLAKPIDSEVEPIEVTVSLQSPPIYVLTASSTRSTLAAVAAVNRVIERIQAWTKAQGLNLSVLEAPVIISEIV